MLDQFEIQGFRCFAHFQVTGLKRINLIAGRNSVGKSALLEAIRFYLQPDLDGLADMIEWRDGVPGGRSFWNREVLSSVFHHGSGQMETPSMRLSADRALDLNVAWHRLTPEGTWKPVDQENGNQASESMTKPVLRFEYPNSRSPFFFLPLDGSIDIAAPPQGTRRAERAFLRYANAAERPAIYVRAGDLDSDVLSELFERVAATDAEILVNQVIRWIVPDAERLLTKGAGDERAIYLKCASANRPEPLKRFGDGVTRLVALALALANTRNGYCLIDEIENGLHYELFDEVWKQIAQMSKLLNVQVFATTHSKDCIEAFERSFRLADFDACFYRLERAGDDIRAVRLDYGSFFSVVAGQGYEIR